MYYIELLRNTLMCCFAFKTNFVLISPQGCRDETTALSLLPLFFFFCRSFIFCLERFGTFKQMRHVFADGSTLNCWSWLLFYADPSLGCDNRNSRLSCWTSCLLLSGPSWVPSSSQGRPLKRMFTHWDCVHSPQCFSFQRILFPSLHRGFGLRGQADNRVGSDPSAFLKSPDFTRLKPQGGRQRDGLRAGSGMLSSSFNS